MEVDPTPGSVTPKVVARESVVVAIEFVVVAVIVVVAVVVVVSVVVVVAAGVVDEHGDDGQEDGDGGEEEDAVHEPKVRGNGKADEELPHLQVEDLPKIGSRALEVSLGKQVEVKHNRRSKSMFVFGLKEISA